MQHYLKEPFISLLWKPKIGWNTIDIIPYSKSFDYSFDSHFGCFRYRGQCFNDRDNPISDKFLNNVHNLDALIHRSTKEEVYTLFYNK